MSEELHATLEGSIQVCGVTIDCYMTSDGRRILECGGVKRLIAAITGGCEVTTDDANVIATLAKTGRVMSKVSP